MLLGEVEGKYEGAHFTDVPEDAVALFNVTPYGFHHTLSSLDLFEFDAIRALARKYDHDFFVAGSASSPGERFYSVDSGMYTPYDALERLDVENQRVLLKRPEQYDARYGDLMLALFK